jgi:nucleotide-binding universal stress UspA family protein
MQKALGYKHIVAAVAIHVTAHPVMRRAVNMAEKTQGGVTLVHALKDQAKSKPEQVKRQLKQLEASQPLVHGIRLVTGRKWSAINQIADESGADLIVIGSYVHGQLRALLGETSNRVLRNANRDVQFFWAISLLYRDQLVLLVPLVRLPSILKKLTD